MALAHILGKDYDNQVVLWGRDSEKIEKWRPLGKAVRRGQIVFLAIPTQALAGILKTLPSGLMPIVLSKGLNQEGENAWEIAQEIYPTNLAIISGPMIAEEMVKDKQASALVAGDQKVAERLISLFNQTNLSLKFSDDSTGVSWCGPLKNIYAIGLGMAEGAELGNNQKGSLVQEAVSEMSAIIELFSGWKETAFSLAGIGDLVATGFSDYSSNFQLGVKLAKGQTWEQPTEGAVAALGLKRRMNEKINDFPLLARIVEKVVNTTRLSEMINPSG